MQIVQALEVVEIDGGRVRIRAARIVLGEALASHARRVGRPGSAGLGVGDGAGAMGVGHVQVGEGRFVARCGAE